MRITVTFESEELCASSTDLHLAVELVRSLSKARGVTTLIVENDEGVPEAQAEPEEKFYYIYDLVRKVKQITSAQHCTCEYFVRGMGRCSHMYTLEEAPVGTLLELARSEYDDLMSTRWGK